MNKVYSLSLPDLLKEITANNITLTDIGRGRTAAITRQKTPAITSCAFTSVAKLYSRTTFELPYMQSFIYANYKDKGWAIFDDNTCYEIFIFL
ncbi:hypothetical protein ACQ4LE_007088 [Meloidogyne hapla]